METNSFTLTRKELYDLVWSISMTALSKQYAISDNGLRKIAKNMNTPWPGNGHWMKLQFGKKVKVIPLPEDANVKQLVELELRKEGEPLHSSNPVKERMKEFSFTVPEKLHTPDQLIVIAKQRLTSKDSFERYPGIIGCRSDELDIEVARKHAGRALLFMDALIKALRTRHHEIEINNWKTYAIVQGEQLQIKFREKMKRVVVNDRDWGNTEMQSTGLLCFRVDGYYGKEWADSKDGVTLVESKLSEIIAWLEINGHRKADEMAYHRNQWTLREAEEEKEKKIEHRREEEFGKFLELVSEAERWKQAVLIRKYVKAASAAGSADPDWMEWARKKADWVDSAVQAEDGVLGKWSLNLRV